MRRLLLLVPLALFVLVAIVLYRGLFLDPTRLPSALIGKHFPGFSLPALEQPSRILTRQDLTGQPALVNVWATWCPSCRQEHAMLTRLADQGVAIYGVNYKDDRNAAQAWLRTLRNPYRLTIEDASGTLGLDLGVYGAPETYLVDARGVIRQKFIGPIDARAWREELGPTYHALRQEATP